MHSESYFDSKPGEIHEIIESAFNVIKKSKAMLIKSFYNDNQSFVGAVLREFSEFHEINCESSDSGTETDILDDNISDREY
jgi:hypothetical protein